jgi:hypothetical protein
MKIKKIIVALLLIFLAGCKSSNDPANDESGMIYYYALQDNDVAADGSGFFSYDVSSNTETLMTIKKIIKATHIADNGRFVALEETKEGEIEFYGICDGNLIKVPKPSEYNNVFETINYKNSIADYPMEIDKAGHNFVFLTYHRDMDDEIMYFPVLARFNCEEWKMNIIDFKDDFLKKLPEMPQEVLPNPDILIEDDEIYFSLNVNFSNRNEQYICLIKDDKLTLMHKADSPSNIRLLSCMKSFDRYLFIETDYGNIIKKIKLSENGIEEMNQNSKMSFKNNCKNFHKIHKNYLYGIKDDIVKIDLNNGTEEIIYTHQELNKFDANAEFYSIYIDNIGNKFAFTTKNNDKTALYIESSSGDIQEVAKRNEIRFLTMSGD